MSKTYLKKGVVSVISAAALLVTGMLQGCVPAGSLSSDSVPKENAVSGDEAVAADKEGTVEGQDASGDDYELVWADEFDGDSLNTDDWNVETHEPGWVNAELQRYTSLEEGNIEVSDGTLKIKPHIEKDEDGSEQITSGRITTQNKHDFTYGRFEARA